jgi:hypothetical protein
LITWNAAAVIEVHANVHAACPDKAQRAAAVGWPRASCCQALGPPSMPSHQFPPAKLPPLPPTLWTALRVGQHNPDVGLKVLPFRCPIPVNDHLIVVVILACLCPVVVPLPPINCAIISLVILYQPFSLLVKSLVDC